MPFGLSPSDLHQIVAIIKKYPEIEQAIIFGSRAKGNYKKGSDVDIALKGSKISADTVSNVSYLLNEETLLPYYFDVLHLEQISNPDLIEHIKRVGKALLSQDKDRSLRIAKI